MTKQSPLPQSILPNQRLLQRTDIRKYEQPIHKAMKLSALTHSHSTGRSTRRKTTTAFIVAATLGLTSAAICAAPENIKPATDAQITNAIDYELLTDAALLNNQVFANTSNGMVTSAGTADHLIAKARAVKLAQTSYGAKTRPNN